LKIPFLRKKHSRTFFTHVTNSFCFSFEVNANSEDDFYTAAVVEFPLPTSPNSVVTNVDSMVVETLDEYTRLINEAAESGADIVAFPEGCLNYVGIATRSTLIKHAVEVNDNDLRNSTTFEGEECDYSKKSPVSVSTFSPREL
jgi:hypothetical protein